MEERNIKIQGTQNEGLDSQRIKLLIQKADQLQKKLNDSEKNMIHKKIMAQELTTELKRSKATLLISMAGVFFTYLATTAIPKYGTIIGIAIAITFIGTLSFSLYKITQNLNYLKANYGTK